MKKDLYPQSFVLYHYDNLKVSPLHQSKAIQQEEEHWSTKATFEGTFSRCMKNII